MTLLHIAPVTKAEAAARWRLKIEADDAVAQSEDFLAWFAEPLNQDAYERTSAAWGVFEDYLAAPELVRIRRDALDRAHIAPAQRHRFLRRPLVVAAAAMVVSTLIAAAIWQLTTAPDIYRTSIGERRVVSLEDGSHISLDSASRVEVRYTKSERELSLIQGRARFDVAHDIARPFTVAAGDETVIAVGTAFDVERLGKKTLVTLIEGTVIVKTATALELMGKPMMDTVASVAKPKIKPITLLAGQELVAAHNVVPAIKPINLQVATAWETGRLVLNNEPLCEAVERVNRYTENPLEVDPSVASVRISGVFNAGDIAAFVDAVTSYFPVQATISSDKRVLLQKKG